MRGSMITIHNGTNGKQFQFTPLHERQREKKEKPGMRSIFQFTPLHERQQRGGKQVVKSI